MVIAPGKLIVIEGLEGAGKSTAVATITHLLHQRNLKVISTREPGGTTIGELLRDIIKDPQYKDSLNDKSELLLMYAARVQLIEEVIKPALAQGIWVIADRFELSTYAYQGGGRGVNLEMIQQLSRFCLAGFTPDLTLYLDLSPEEGMTRAKARGQFDRIEQQAMEFFHKVHAMYLQCIKEQPNIVRVDAQHSLAQVQQHIVDALNHFIGT